MKSRSFTTLSEKTHRIWLSNALNIPTTDGSGVDLLSDNFGVELKSRYSVHRNTFVVHHYQIDEFRTDNPDVNLYWAFLLYDMSTPPSAIRGKNVDPYITHRTTWLFEWDWVKQYPVSRPKTGPYIYIHSRYFDDNTTFSPMNAENGKIYVPKGTSIEEKLKKEGMMRPLKKAFNMVA
jgi:hypothetical protein